MRASTHSLFFFFFVLFSLFIRNARTYPHIPAHTRTYTHIHTDTHRYTHIHIHTQREGMCVCACVLAPWHEYCTPAHLSQPQGTPHTPTHIYHSAMARVSHTYAPITAPGHPSHTYTHLSQPQPTWTGNSEVILSLANTRTVSLDTR